MFCDDNFKSILGSPLVSRPRVQKSLDKSLLNILPAKEAKKVLRIAATPANIHGPVSESIVEESLEGRASRERCGPLDREVTQTC